MNEIPKSGSGIPQQTQKIEQVKPEVSQEIDQQPFAEAQVSKEIKEITENPADRSAVKVDNLENDMKVFAKNPELAEKAMQVAQIAEQKAAQNGEADPVFKGLAVGQAFIEEFKK